METFHGRAFVDPDRGNAQLIDIGAFVMLRIGNRRLQDLAQLVRATLGAERQHLQGPVNRQSADLIGHQTGLLGRDMDVFQLC